jgi:hypothetical protein
MKAGDCKHFTGIQHDACAAGVDYKSVREKPERGPYLWPCLPRTMHEFGRPTCSIKCAKFEATTPEEEAAFMKQVDDVLARHEKGEPLKPGESVFTCPKIGDDDVED